MPAPKRSTQSTRATKRDQPAAHVVPASTASAPLRVGPPKAKRGRPPKNPQDAVEPRAADSATAPPKGRRGRPCKVSRKKAAPVAVEPPASEPEEEGDEEVQVIDIESDEDERDGEEVLSSGDEFEPPQDEVEEEDESDLSGEEEEAPAPRSALPLPPPPAVQVITGKPHIYGSPAAMVNKGKGKGKAPASPPPVLSYEKPPVPNYRANVAPAFSCTPPNVKRSIFAQPTPRHDPGVGSSKLPPSTKAKRSAAALADEAPAPTTPQQAKRVRFNSDRTLTPSQRKHLQAQRDTQIRRVEELENELVLAKSFLDGLESTLDQ